MKPILKWAGGKKNALKDLLALIQPLLTGENTYYEPFVGGGAVAFALEYPKTVIGDKNFELPNVYREIKDEPDALLKDLKEHQVEHEKNAKMWYSIIRSLDTYIDWPWYYTKSTVAARTIYLNRVGFNGLYRVNKKGKFNVPLGRTISGKAPDIVQEERLTALHDYLQSVDIREGDFEQTVADAKAGDVLYFDPPYDYQNVPTGFTMYQPDGFTQEDLKRLRKICDDLVERGCKVILSNNDTDFVRETFSGYSFKEIETKRSINPESPHRRIGKEVIIYKV